MIIDQQVYSKPEACGYLRISARTLDRYLKAGIVKGIRLTKRKILFTRQDLDNSLQSLIKNV